jgi:beta-xylosidase
MRLLNHRIVLTCLLVLAANIVSALAWETDNGDGTFTNPALNADYPDPDIIRVGDDFYFATTTFVNSPGLRILHSKDLLHWEIIGHVIPQLDGRPAYDMQGGTAYRSGIYAPSLRYHDGCFYVVVTPVDQNTRIYRAADPRGPWEMRELDRPAFDPGLFFDVDGKAYILTSGGWDGTIQMLELNADLSSVVSSSKIHYIKGAEGSKVIKRGDWYYLFNSIPNRLGMTVSRSKNLHGPWETRPSIDDKTGGHQGALVDLADGSWFGFVMLDAGAIGRVTNFSPVFWQDDWPIWGTAEAPNQVPAKAAKPVAVHSTVQPATSDSFDSPRLGLQWAWNHNPDNTRWSLSERSGWLRLKPTQASSFWLARNTLTQKGQGPWSRGEVKLDLRHLKPGDVCGFGTLGKYNGHIAAACDAEGKLSLSMKMEESIEKGTREETKASGRALASADLWLRVEMNFQTARGHCSYSLDGKAWQDFGADFPLAYDWRTGTFQGPQYAIFCYNAKPGDGFVDVDSFTFVDHP